MDLQIINFISQECAHQQSGERSVFLMCVAWQTAMAHEGPITEEDILLLAEMVDIRNEKGYRTTPVTFANGEVLKASHVERQMELFLTGMGLQPPGIKSMTPQEAYEWFERVHPFEDGNGRIGKILFNYLNGTLETPIFPKDPFN